VHCSLVDILEISKMADPRAQLLVNFSIGFFHLINPLVQSVKETPIRNQVLVLNPDFLFDPQLVIKRERITPPTTSSTTTPPPEKTSVVTECQTTLTGATADELNKDISRLRAEVEQLQSTYSDLSNKIKALKMPHRYTATLSLNFAIYATIQKMHSKMSKFQNSI